MNSFFFGKICYEFFLVLVLLLIFHLLTCIVPWSIIIIPVGIPRFSEKWLANQPSTIDECYIEWVSLRDTRLNMADIFGMGPELCGERMIS